MKVALDASPSALSAGLDWAISRSDLTPRCSSFMLYAIGDIPTLFTASTASCTRLLAVASELPLAALCAREDSTISVFG